MLGTNSHSNSNSFMGMNIPSFSSKPNNGVSIKTVNTGVLLTIIWTFVSCIIMYGGYKHCSWNSYKYTLNCDQITCKYTLSEPNYYLTKTIPRDSIKNAEWVRITAEGNIVDSKDKNNRKDGWSLKLSYDDKPPSAIGGHRVSVDQTLLFSKKDMRRKAAKSGTAKLHKYIRKETDKLDLLNKSNVTIVGILIMFLGFISLLFSCVLGSWSESKPRFKKRL